MEESNIDFDVVEAMASKQRHWNMGAPLSYAQEGSGVSSETYKGHSRKRCTFAYRFQTRLPILALILILRIHAIANAATTPAHLRGSGRYLRGNGVTFASRGSH